MALFLVVAYQIEEKYGFWRIILLYFISALGGESLKDLMLTRSGQMCLLYKVVEWILMHVGLLPR